jgi:lysophospholipase L1-like esterase
MNHPRDSPSLFVVAVLIGFLFLTGSLSAQSDPSATSPGSKLIPVDSPAFVFSPGNWVGDEGRGGKLFRQAWNSYAYFRLAWDSPNANPTASLQMDVSTYPPDFKPPKLVYCLDGVWKADVTCAAEIPLTGIAATGRHELWVYVQSSEQVQRWDSDNTRATNVVRITGLRVDAESLPIPDAPKTPWALIVGDSITEGIGTSALGPYSYLLGRALKTRGYEFCISACGFSGWIHQGDNGGDVPAYYVMKTAANGGVPEYDDTASRWNKIDGNRHTLLDANGHLSAYGQTGQEPGLIFINYGTNDNRSEVPNPDGILRLTEGLSALRASAPDARIVLLIPFGQYFAKEIHSAVKNYQETHPGDTNLSVLDLGPGLARALAAKNGLLGGLHPNDKGHALIASQLIPQVLNLLPAEKK